MTKKLYFVTDVDGNPDSWLADGKRFREIPILTPLAPAILEKGMPYVVNLVTGEDTSAAQKEGFQVEATLHLDSPDLDASHLEVRLNDVLLEGIPAHDSDDGWVDFPVPAEAIRKGDNAVEVSVRSLPAAPNTEWTHSYDGTTLPPSIWRRDGGGKHVVERVVDDGSLLIGDWAKVADGYRLYRHSWGTDPENKSVFEARAKIVSGLNYMLFTNGKAGERLRLLPDKILLHHHPKMIWEMDTTDQFHDYRIELIGSDVKVFVDGELRIDAPGAMVESPSYPRNEICFGGSNHDGPGTAYWDHVSFRAGRKDFPLRDLALSVEYKKAE